MSLPRVNTVWVGNKRWTIILPAVFIMYTLSFFERVNIGMALPHIVAESKLTLVEAGWLFCAIWFYLVPKNIQAARWLSQSDREVIEAELAAEQARHTEQKSDPWWTILRIPALWLMLAGYSLHSMLAYGFTLWLPTALKGYGTLSEFMVGFISGLPFLMTMVGIWYITRRSDRFNQERRLHAAIPTVLCGMALSAAAFVPQSLYWLQIALFMFVGLTMKMLVPLVYVRLTEILPTRRPCQRWRLSGRAATLSASLAARWWLANTSAAARR